MEARHAWKALTVTGDANRVSRWPVPLLPEPLLHLLERVSSVELGARLCSQSPRYRLVLGPADLLAVNGADAVILEVSTDTRLSRRCGVPRWRRFIRVLVPFGWPRFAARSARPLAGGLSHLDLVRRGRWGPISFPRPVGAGNGMPGGRGRRSRRARRGRSPQEGGAVLKR